MHAQDVASRSLRDNKTETVYWSGNVRLPKAKCHYDDVVVSNGFHMLREIGVRVSIDDFGTGYSSLSALADITADEIKVDRSFISSIHERPRSQSILRTIESLSQALGMSIVQ